MKLKVFADTTSCYGKHCPTVYQTDRGTFVVQGNLVDASVAADISVGSHEGLVEIPEDLARVFAAKFIDSH